MSKLTSQINIFETTCLYHIYWQTICNMPLLLLLLYIFYWQKCQTTQTVRPTITLYILLNHFHMRQKYIMSLELARVYLKIVELQLLYNSPLSIYILSSFLIYQVFHHKKKKQLEQKIDKEKEDLWDYTLQHSDGAYNSGAVVHH